MVDTKFRLLSTKQREKEAGRERRVRSFGIVKEVRCVRRARCSTGRRFFKKNSSRSSYRVSDDQIFLLGFQRVGRRGERAPCPSR